MNDLKPNAKASRPRKRKARGIGSGNGKTAGRGYNGQRSRSGSSIPAWFEGGQNPLYRRVPKRGFTNIFRTIYAEINIQRLIDKLELAKNSELKSTTVLSIPEFLKLGLIKKKKLQVKLIGAHVSASELDLSKLEGKTLKADSISKSLLKQFEAKAISFEKFERPKKEKKEQGKK